MPQPPRRPRNVLMIISDQHRQDAAGCYGHPIVQTPHLDRLASQGERFTHAYCQSPLCGPSRSSVMTGLYPHTCKAYTHQCDELPDLPTLGSVFRDAGYATGAIGKVHVRGETRQRDLGFDDRQLRYYTYGLEDYRNAIGDENVRRYNIAMTGLDRYQDVYNPTNKPIDLDEDQIFDALVVDRCETFLEQHKDEPFFLWAGLEKPHPDWHAPKRFHDMYPPEDMPLPPTAFEDRRDIPEPWYVSTRQAWCFEESEMRACIAAYYANVSYTDEMVGRLLDKLDALGLANDTAVVYVSDHGEMLFDQGMLQKHNFFEGSARVPMILRIPGHTKPGAVRDDVAGLIDLLPTFCDAAGVTAPKGLEGASLLHAQPTDRAVCSEFYEWGMPERMIRRGLWKYVYSHGQTCQLYHLDDDPHETRNLIDDPAHASVRQSLHAQLMADWEMPAEGEVRFKGMWNTPENFDAGITAWKKQRASSQSGDALAS